MMRLGQRPPVMTTTAPLPRIRGAWWLAAMVVSGLLWWGLLAGLGALYHALRG